MSDTTSFLVGVIVGLLIGLPLGMGCAWRYWREKLRREYQDKSKYN